MKIANRKAKDDRESGLNALEAYANIGVNPEDWKRFNLKFPEFFPKEVSEWFYWFAESWAKQFPDRPPEGDKLRPPLLFYSDRLRRVWARDDREGINLKLLYGLEQEVRDKHELPRPFMPARWDVKRGKIRFLGGYIPGQPADLDKQTTFAGLPQGRPVVDGVTGAITWKFGCTLQQSVYELMQQRWRAMVCPECGKFFLADKTRQVYCSSICFGEMKRKRSLDHWNRVGRAERDKRRVKKKGRKT